MIAVRAMTFRPNLKKWADLQHVQQAAYAERLSVEDDSLTAAVKDTFQVENFNQRFY